MAAMAATSFSLLGLIGGNGKNLAGRRRIAAAVTPQEAQVSEEVQEEKQPEEPKVKNQKRMPEKRVEPQLMAQSKNMGREYGGDWLSSVTRHVRIYAAYIDPVTHAFDQTQMDKLTIILDPQNEFNWNYDTCNMVYTYFQELVDHYEGAPLTEYTLRLIGSDVEHYIRKLLYDGEITYNMNARQLNFSMGKPRVIFNANDESQIQGIVPQ
ncbi:NAD(P)H-quinone oxidoreductase subunit M, chloroplastic-like [Papaver somniferum]|nr:NAD(P)H-quinone oxidoreductase subunit M, chloroplastic-like [Papaver somniferum]